jgi:glycine/D-amino acid oxidase-like deaminating enzyme
VSPVTPAARAPAAPAAPTGATATGRVVVVGAGVTGLLTAVECALAGHRVTVLDSGAIPNPRSSSYDQHRAIRTFVPGDPAATRRLAAAHRRWLELETLLGQGTGTATGTATGFYRPVGVVTAWPRERLPELTASAAAAGVPVETAAPEKLPHLGFPAGSVGVRESAAGVLLAERALRAAARWLAGHPAVTLRPYTAVTGIDTAAGRVTPVGGRPLGADLVLVAAGPGTCDLVGQAGQPVRLLRQTMVYLRPPDRLAPWWQSAPAAGGLGADGRGWLLPPGDGTLLKISSDAVCREAADADSDGEDQAPWAGQLLQAAILRDVETYTVAAVKACHYVTDAQTGGALLTRVGPAVWARAACGGSGFSTAPLVAGQIVDALMERVA